MEKNDKKKLMAMDIDLSIKLPVTDIEKQMAVIWPDVLKVPVKTIGRHNFFFALGGNSLTSPILLKKMNTYFQTSLSQLSLFK